ncbi:MAG: hypothetical protein JNK02_07975 [Planctomycetes bacterium]|nr:hypothetical protein [Planctomycetota bacterium]
MLRALRGLGYSLTLRRAGWWECLLVRAAERWQGQGSTRREAVDDAVRALLPSHAAREAFDHLAAGVQQCRVERAVAAAALALPTAHETPQADQGAATDGAVAPSAPTAGGAAAHQPAARSSVLVDRELIPAARPPAPLAADRLPIAEGIAQLDELRAKIEATIAEAGLLAPDRQRLLVVAWMARARDVEARARGGAVAERAFGIVRRLEEATRVWWPGAIRALGIDRLPSECARDIPGVIASDLSSWGRVADAAEAALEALEFATVDDLDRDGWADAAQLEPPPPEPEGLLVAVAAQIEDLPAPVPASFTLGVDANDRDAQLAACLPQMRWLARRLRWLRGATAQLETWATAMGRLRYLSAQLRPRDPELERLLDARHAPEAPWSRVIGFDPRKAEIKASKKRLLSGAPRPSSTREELVTWLRESFALGSDLPDERIAERLTEQEVGERVLELPAEVFSKLSHRRRLDAVQGFLRGVSSLPAGETSAAEEPAPDRRVDSLAPYLAALLPRTRGKRVLVVSNRNDPELDEKLRELFCFAEVDHCEVKNSNVASRAQSIERGTYDLVLAATGFLSHTAEGVLRDAARRSGVLHVRVNRGRPLSVARALARELGLTPIPAPSRAAG